VEVLSARYDSDASAFMVWNIPAIDFHSLTRDSLPLLHSKRDIPAAIDQASYYRQYQFLVAYLSYLDRKL
jgi:Iap family predicted aminopeptidase